MAQGMVTGVSVSHRHADLDDIESVGIGDETVALCRLLAGDDITESFVLETCNRAEAYVVGPTQERGRDIIADVLPGLQTVKPRWLNHDDALEHLLRVGAGLESMVIGENEILGQLRSARVVADRANALGPILSETIDKAIRVGERARTETSINEGVLSLGRAAVDLAADLRPLDGCTAVVVGAGEMGHLVAHALIDHEVERVRICNRTRSRAASLATKLDGEADDLGLGDLPSAVADAALVITATSSRDAVVDETTVNDAGETIVIDMAQPRDVAPSVGSLPGIDLFDLDDLESRTAANARRRERAGADVEAIVAAELDRLHAQLKRKQADHVIATMYEGATAIKRRELETAIAKLETHESLGEIERGVIESLADAIVGQIMAAPTKSVRDAAEREDWATLQTALQLFDPDFETGGVREADYPTIVEPERISDDA